MNKVNFSLLQIFRGWAAVLVVLVHATGITADQHGQPFLGSFFAMGNAGVDFFFVLSGFLIFYIHQGDFAQPHRLATYLRKRVVRIFPIYWLVTLLILPVYFIVAHYGQGDETQPSIIAGSLLLLPMTRSPILVAGWSLRHEMLFYLWFALLIGLRPRYARPIIGVWIVGVIGSVIMSLGGPHRFENPVIHLLWWPQNFEFLIGCLAAWLVARMPTSRLPRGACIVLLVMGLVAFLSTGLFPGPIYELARSEHVLLYGSLSFVIIVASTMLDRQGGLAIARSGPYRGMALLGDASYSLYLVHGPVLSVLYKVAGSQQLLTRYGTHLITPIIITITLLAGLLAHVCLERPLLQKLPRGSDKFISTSISPCESSSVVSNPSKSIR